MGLTASWRLYPGLLPVSLLFLDQHIPEACSSHGHTLGTQEDKPNFTCTFKAFVQFASCDIPLASHIAEPNINRERKYTQPPVGRTAKSHGKGHRNKKHNKLGINAICHKRECGWPFMGQMATSGLSKCG